ncbi:hypothetical protein L0668_02705 [Paraglaciecola aquimarina]|uniref:DUF3828 domain-containing protein n=1 Tax=Paraglaciecola algarum TaxID=3050085 RepID=A0ABS9D297_9ALTE|nr:hypothetical protein [Paraglaciecola sp. G1-23]MCF2947001.1 hypothetical protein [Paraglaciecola sp. G1-23]
MLRKFSWLMLLIVVFTACEKAEPKKGVGKFGMLDSNVPEFAAIEFFNKIYKTNDLSGAIEYSTPKMERLLRSYHTNKAVQKHVLNMRFDEVTVQPSTRSAGRNEFAKEAQISLFFEGTLDGDIFKDLRVVSLIRIDKEWKVDSVSAG